jgi:hypothetical protein
MGGSNTIQPPTAPNYQESMRSILEAQVAMAPQVYASEAQYQPMYQQLQSQLQAQSARDQLALYGQLQPSYSNLENAYSKATQENQLQGLQQRAPGYVQAFQQAQGTAGINQALQNYAQNDLAKQMQQGFQLSPEEQRTLNQQSLQGYAARGTALGQQAGLASVLNRYNFTQGRQQQALQTATGLGNYFSQQSQPALASFYQQPMYAQTAGGSTINNALSSQQQAGPALFNPESQTGMGSIYGAYNAQMGLAGAQAQAKAGQNAGMMSAGGAVAGAAIMAVGLCWIARACYGENNNKWKQFRKSMLRNASDKFISWYCKNGKNVASKINSSALARFVGRIILTGISGTWILLKLN